MKVVGRYLKPIENRLGHDHRRRKRDQPPGPAAGGGPEERGFELFQGLGVDDHKVGIATFQHRAEVGAFHLAGQQYDFLGRGRKLPWGVVKR